MPPLKLLLPGQRFGNLVIVARAANRKSLSYYTVRCDCSEMREVYRSTLARGRQTSCGCGRLSPRLPAPSPPPRGAAWVPVAGSPPALVDVADLSLVTSFNWSLDSAGYPHTGGKLKVRMHNAILPDADLVDHENLNKLDNRRVNLRPATPSQSVCNQARRKDNTSGYKGVGFYKPKKIWRARISYEHHQRVLGYFHSPEEAAHVYDAAARLIHGAFARFNFPRLGEQQA